MDGRVIASALTASHDPRHQREFIKMENHNIRTLILEMGCEVRDQVSPCAFPDVTALRAIAGDVDTAADHGAANWISCCEDPQLNLSTALRCPRSCA
jgi:hypothetical protein